ncbi:MAG: hypothetical protein FWF58_04990 [Firmicutes bacterium]|nr:hypothetical protein [Bacillota bacterium]
MGGFPKSFFDSFLASKKNIVGFVESLYLCLIISLSHMALLSLKIFDNDYYLCYTKINLGAERNSPPTV